MEESATAGEKAEWNVPQYYAVLVLALTFGLLLSDYMSRQVLSAVFPLIKSEWGLSDAALGSLSGVVATMVGLLTFPLSLVADRIGRVRSVTAMAILWSLATLACGLSSRYGEMLAARLCVGLGEAAYGSVGVAIVVSVFPARLRATIVGIFGAGAVLGSVIGMSLGGIIAQQAGWRLAFIAMAGLGLLLAACYPLVVKERRAGASVAGISGASSLLDLLSADGWHTILPALFPGATVVLCYLGSGLGLFASSALISWFSSYLNRYYRMTPDRAAVIASIFVLAGGIGMIACGGLADRLARFDPNRRLQLSCVYSVLTAFFCAIAFGLAPGAAQLLFSGLALFFSAGTFGPAGAVVAGRTNPAMHATVFATMTLTNNFLGLAPGPILTGMFADHWGLLGAFRVLPVPAIIAAALFWLAQRDRRSVQSL